MDLSIIICCYRGEKTIEECLLSLCSQTYDKQKYEVIIVDDDSIDNSAERINSFLKKIKIIILTLNILKKKIEVLVLQEILVLQKQSPI